MLSARPVGLPIDADRGIAIKTPGRVLTKTRNALQENAVHNVPTTVVGKGKKIAQNVPFQTKTLQVERTLRDPTGRQVDPSKAKDASIIRPLGDKTPFPNRTANPLLAAGAKIDKLALSNGSLRPSSSRKYDRLPRSASKAFETPITNGKHWDVSDIEIQVDSPAANQSIEEENYDEIEYMPPKAEDIPYEPPFEMPNYREVGKTLMALIRSYTLEDDSPSTDITFTADASESNFFTPPTLPQQEIEDDGPFVRVKTEIEIKPQPSNVKQRLAITVKATTRPAVQRTTPRTRTTMPVTSQARPAVRRPATSASTRPPTATARTSSSQPVTRASTSQSTLRPSVSRVTTRAPSVARATPPVRAGHGSARPSRATSVSQPPLKATARSTAPIAPAKEKTAKTQPTAIPITESPVSPSNSSPSNGRPRSGTITKAEFEANTHIAIHTRNNSLEDVKKDLEGLIVFEDAFDEDDGFRFDV